MPTAKEGDGDGGPPPVVQRMATDLPAEELQAEFLRYAIPAGDVASRVNALQRMYDDEFTTSQREYEEYLKRQHMKKVRREYEEAGEAMKVLEQTALARDDKTMTLVRLIESNAAPMHLVVRCVAPLACCALLRAMRSNTNVLTLDLSNNHLSDVVGESLGKMLAKNARLRGLNLGFNRLTSLTLGPLGRALQSNRVLTSLSLESNAILATASPATSSSSSATSGNPGDASSALAGFEAFMVAIASSSSLTSLNLFNTQMTFDVGRAFVRALENNASLIAVEIGGNAITQNDMAAIATKLRKTQAHLAEAQEKTAVLWRDLKQGAEEMYEAHAKEAKQKADHDWHEANARERAEIREREEWERARRQAEEDVRTAMEIEAQQKKYLQQIEEKNAKATKGKK